MDFTHKDSLDGNKMDIEKELTNKFLSGEISFADYSSEWYMNEDVEDIDEPKKQDNEPQQSTSQIDKSEIQKRTRRITRLTPNLLGLMGEANLRFARGDIEMAEKMCHEVIKQLPTASEPYQLLAQIHENDKEKSLQFSLISAHLRPSDTNEWLRLAAISKDMRDYKQEMFCYTQAIRAKPYNLDIHLQRLEALKKLDEMKYPTSTLGVTTVKCYHRIVNAMPASESETIMKYARLAVTLYHNNNESERALDVFESAYKKCGSNFNYEDLNIFLELLIMQKQFNTCIEVFVANVGVEIEAEILTVQNTNNEVEEHTNYVNCTIPNDLPIDLKSKLLICFIHLGAINLVQTLLNDFTTNNVSKAGDLFMDIEEALTWQGYYDLALTLIEPLVTNPNFDLGAVWLKHAECLKNLGRDDEAVASYQRVLKHVPQHPDARRELFLILEKKGDIDKALQVIQQDYRYVVSAKLLYEQCQVLKRYELWFEYLEVGEALLSKSFFKYRHPEEINHAFKLKGGMETIFNFRAARNEDPYDSNVIHFDENETFKLSPQEEWDLFIDLLDVASRQKHFYLMQRLSFGSIGSRNLSQHRGDIEFYCLQSSLLNKDYQRAFRFIRDIAMKSPSPRAWNILNLVVNSLEENTHSKFISRLFQKDNYTMKSIFLGNSFLVSGRYLVALKYFLEHNERYKDPLSSLLIAITILVMASQRTVDKHHNLVLQGMSYMLAYQNLRKCDQETYYNIGRAYHMLSINNLAVDYYEKALASRPVMSCDRHGVMDLSKEIAYNLCLLYKDHSPKLARSYMLKYLVIE